MESFILQTFLFISLGAALGANLRYFVGQCVARLIPSSLPYGTLIINVTGSFILALFLVWTTERVLADPRWRLIIAVGFCGGYTTFSSYAYETFALFEQGQWLTCALNILANNVLCLSGTVLGAMLARAV
ncbi:MAG: fluoride efflux transporter CrcB [Bryobacteraceae bacterium]